MKANLQNIYKVKVVPIVKKPAFAQPSSANNPN